MSAVARRAGLQTFRTPATRTPARQFRRTYAEKDAEGERKDVLREGARRDPELYVCKHFTRLCSWESLRHDLADTVAI